MKKLKLAVLSATLSLSAATSFSVASQTLVSDWVGINSVYTPVTGMPFIDFAGELAGCYTNSGAYLTVNTVSGEGRLLYSSLLAAQASKKKVRVYYKLNDVEAGYNGWGLCSLVAISTK